MTLLNGHKAYPAVEVNKQTGECFSLYRHNRGQREDFATVYTLSSPSKGVILQVRIADYQHYAFMSY